MEPVTYLLPASWASYLLNGDSSDIGPQEKEEVHAFLAKRDLCAPVCCEDVGFRWANDAIDTGPCATQGQACAVYTFLTFPN